MKVDYFSDPHFDYWFTPKNEINYNKLDRQFKKLCSFGTWRSINNCW